MPKTLQREPQGFTADEFLSEDCDLPRKMELVEGVIGPFSDRAKRALLANWGADKIIKLTGLEIWREAIEAMGNRRESS